MACASLYRAISAASAFPELKEALASLPVQNAILDGEIDASEQLV
jgi:ATP-dependent DNA ligase